MLSPCRGVLACNNRMMLSPCRGVLACNNSMMLSPCRGVLACNNSIMMLSPSRGVLASLNHVIASHWKHCLFHILTIVVKENPKISHNNPRRMHHWPCTCLDTFTPHSLFINATICLLKGTLRVDLFTLSTICNDDSCHSIITWLQSKDIQCLYYVYLYHHL